MKHSNKNLLKKSFFLPKKQSFLLILIILLLTVISCNKSIEINNNQDFKDFTFQQLLYKKHGKCDLKNPEKLYYTSSIDNLLLRHVFTSHGNLYQFEVNYPEYTGIIDTCSIYNGYSDDGKWIDKIISEVFEGDSSFDNDDFSISRPFSVSGNKGDESIDAEKVTTLWIESNQRLNAMKYDDEIFVPVQKNGNYILIDSSKSKTTRSFYDENFILQKKEVWKISTPIDSKLIQNELFNYDKNGILESKVVESEAYKINTYYNQDKLPVRTDKFIINENKIEYLSTRTLWRYTNDKKISIEECSEYSYKNDDYKHYSDKITKRQTYSYKEDEEIPPDYKYYEDGKLKMRVIYKTKKDYVSQVFFEDNYSVATYYEDNMKTKDVYILNGQVNRVKKYD